MNKLVIFTGIIMLFLLCGFGITVLRYAIDKPVAKVRLIKICQREGGESRWGGYYAGGFFANVAIISIADDAAFREITLLKSKDGKRANLVFQRNLSLEEGKEYECYGKDSLRGKGIASRWSGFGHHWKVSTIMFGLAFVLVGAIVLALKR